MSSENEKEYDYDEQAASAPVLEEADWVLLPRSKYGNMDIFRAFAQSHPAAAAGGIAMVLTAVTIQPLLLLVCVPFPFPLR